MKIFIVNMLKCNNCTLFQYTLDCPHLNMTKVEKIRVIRTDLINLENKITWISPKISLGRKMAHYKTYFSHTPEDVSSSGHLLWTPIICIAQCDRQLQTSSHQLEIEVGRYAQIPLEKRICQLCHQGVESEEHYVCRCSFFYKIRERYRIN